MIRQFLTLKKVAVWPAVAGLFFGLVAESGAFGSLERNEIFQALGQKEFIRQRAADEAFAVTRSLCYGLPNFFRPTNILLEVSHLRNFDPIYQRSMRDWAALVGRGFAIAYVPEDLNEIIDFRSTYLSALIDSKGFRAGITECKREMGWPSDFDLEGHLEHYLRGYEVFAAVQGYGSFLFGGSALAKGVARHLPKWALWTTLGLSGWLGADYIAGLLELSAQTGIGEHKSSLDQNEYVGRYALFRELLALAQDFGNEFEKDPFSIATKLAQKKLTVKLDRTLPLLVGLRRLMQNPNSLPKGYLPTFKWAVSALELRLSEIEKDRAILATQAFPDSQEKLRLKRFTLLFQIRAENAFSNREIHGARLRLYQKLIQLEYEPTNQALMEEVASLEKSIF